MGSLDIPRRVQLIFLAYFVAAVCSFLSILVVSMIWNSSSRADPSTIGLDYKIMVVVFGIVMIALYAAPLAALVIFAAEKWRIRSSFYYSGWGACVGFLNMIVITQGYFEGHIHNYYLTTVGGAVAGLVYWSIAGRKAGEP